MTVTLYIISPALRARKAQAEPVAKENGQKEEGRKPLKGTGGILRPLRPSIFRAQYRSGANLWMCPRAGSDTEINEAFVLIGVWRYVAPEKVKLKSKESPVDVSADFEEKRTGHEVLFSVQVMDCDGPGLELGRSGLMKPDAISTWHHNPGPVALSGPSRLCSGCIARTQASNVQETRRTQV